MNAKKAQLIKTQLRIKQSLFKLSHAEFPSVTINDETIEPSVVHSIFNYGAKQKLQDSYAGLRDEEQQAEAMNETLNVWAGGYFTLQEKKRAENPTSATASKRGVKVSRLAEVIIGKLPKNRQEKAREANPSDLVKVAKNAMPDIYAESVAIVEAEAKAEQEKAEAEVMELLGGKTKK